MLSPDGQTIAVTGKGERGQGQAGIYLASTSGNGTTEPRFLVEGSSPAWSPDGSRLAFISGGELNLATISDLDSTTTATATTTTTTTLASGLPGIRNPSWSPDGETIAFYSTESGSQDIWLVAADAASPPVQLTTNAAVEDDSRFTPSWSPDGRNIAYISNRAEYWHDDVWLIEVSSGKTEKVSSRLMASSSPVFSPNGQQLGGDGNRQGRILVRRSVLPLPHRSRASRLRPPKAISEAPIDMQVYASDYIMRFDPFWSADGEWVYFPYHERGGLRPVVRASQGRRRNPGKQRWRRLVIARRHT